MELIALIEFKSTEDNFRKEATGIKNNTVRVMNMDEMNKVDYDIDRIKYIKISCVDGIQSFVRELTDITRFETHGVFFYIFSW